MSKLPNTPRRVWTETLGFCDCGLPEETHAFALDLLQSFDRDKFGFEGDTGIYRVQRLISERPEMAAYLITHMFDSLELLEHGGSVGGSWLTELGELVLAVGPMKEGGE